jgi:hypothetical protein
VSKKSDSSCGKTYEACCFISTGVKRQSSALAGGITGYYSEIAEARTEESGKEGRHFMNFNAKM